MAEESTRPAPLGLEANETVVDLEREKSIRFFLEAFLEYIVDHVDWHDLWAYRYFDRGGCFNF